MNSNFSCPEDKDEFNNLKDVFSPNYYDTLKVLISGNIALNW